MKIKLLALAAIMAASFTAAAEDYEQFGDWYFFSNSDALTGEDKSAALIMNGRKSLSVRCEDGALRALLSPDTYLGNERVSVSYRIGDGEVGSFTATISTTGTVVSLPLSLVDELKGGDKAVFRVADFRGTPYTSEFSLKGFDEAASNIPCGE